MTKLSTLTACCLILILSGSAVAQLPELIGIIPSDTTLALFGRHFEAMGDQNNDGYDDILIACKNLTGGGGSPHSIYVIAGGPFIVTDVDITELPVLPSDFALHQNYPNPFNPFTTIEFGLPERAHVVLSVHNILGQQVVTLVDRTLSPGTHTITWDARDNAGRVAASGVYFYKLTTSDFIQARKMILIK